MNKNEQFMRIIRKNTLKFFKEAFGEYPSKEPVGTATLIEQAFEDIRKMAKNESPK